MAAPKAFWYFSTMRSRTLTPPGAPRRVEFNRNKYGHELLIDAATVRAMPAFITDARPHALAFHDILLVTKGRGAVLIDGVDHPVAPGVVVFCRPGQSREWRLASPLDGACLFFTEAFVADTFSDPRFLDQFAFFEPLGARATLPLSRPERAAFVEGFDAMRRELARFDRGATEALRALLYRTLVLLNRWYVARHGAPERAAPNRFVERFHRLVERDFARRHRVADYATRLGVSPGHLNALCRAHAGRSASALIRARIVTEARRLLLYSGMSAAAVADQLGFADPAYFTRFFRRETGAAPTRFRVARR